MGFKSIGWEGMDRTTMALHTAKWQALVNLVTNISGFIKSTEFFDYIRKYNFLRALLHGMS
jgi:hypothetical protein